MICRIGVVIALVAVAAPTASGDPITDRTNAHRHYAAQAWPDAARAYSPVVVANPQNGADAYFLGVSLARAGRCTEAMPVLDRALTLGATGGRSGLVRAHIEAAACAASAGDSANAFSHLDTARLRFRRSKGCRRGPRKCIESDAEWETPARACRK